MSSIEAAARTVFALADVNTAIGYARRVRPPAPVPDLGHLFWVRVEVHLHGVPLDVLHAALAVNDDLAWNAIRHWPDEDRGHEYWSVTAELPGAWLALYSEHQPLSGPVTSSTTAEG